MSSAAGSDDVRALMDRVGALVDEAERQSDPVAKQRLRAVVATVLEVHGLAFARLRDKLGADVFADLAKDPVIATVLLVHDLHPDPLPTRLASVLPEGSAIVRCDDDVVHVLVPSGVPKRWVESRIAEVAPEAASIVVDAASGPVA